MRRLISKLCLIPILTLFVAVACERAAPTAVELPSSDTPDQLLGGLLGGKQVQGYTLVKDPLLPGLTSLKLSQLIGVEGGTIQLLGHTLVVPLGAVSKPTLFTLTVLPTGYVEVDLTATTLSSLLGLVVDVGGKGFAKPIPVSLTYARATNVADPTKLKVLHLHGLLGYGSYEVLPTRVNTFSRTVAADLDHFSRYAVAFPE